MEPDQYTIEETMLDVGDGHQLYVQLWGNDDAETTYIRFHGGPGSGSSEKNKTLFDPAVHRVIFYDQRGAGKSIPSGSIDSNTTDDLVKDISTILDHFGVKSAVFIGGSWGSALPLVYAIHYPERVQRLVINGVFTASRYEINHIEDGRWRDFYPDLWEEYQASVPEQYKQRPSDYHIPRILGDNHDEMIASAMAYDAIEGNMLKLDDRRRPQADPSEYDPARVKIMAHYVSQGCFLEDEFVFKNAHKLTMPIDMVQGRFDMVCPPYAAYRLHKLVPNSQLHWTTAGHTGSERETWSLLKALI